MKGYRFIIFMLALIVSVGMRGQYNPTNPAEPGISYTLTLQATPSGSGTFNVSTTSSYTEGTSVTLRAYANSSYTFVAWEQDGKVISTTSSFTYTMPAANVKLTARYTYNPSSPSEPSDPKLYHKLHLTSDPAAAGYFNVSDGNAYQEGSRLYLQAYSNTWYQFQHWTLNGEVISTSSGFTYTMPTTDVTLTAHYTYCYDPSNPSEPSEPTGTKTSIYGMTENGVQGQTVAYPVYLANDSLAHALVVDLQFPDGFTVHTDDVRLAGRASGHDMTVEALSDNTFRFSLLGDDAFDGVNGKMFEVPVTIPADAQAGQSYPVVLANGVIHSLDGTQQTVSVRSGNICVEKVTEDGLYAKFSFDKLQGRVMFTNQSSDKATAYLWDFGDGTTSTERSPLHIYRQSGTYTVTLTATGESASDVAEMTVLVNDESTWKVDGTFYLSAEATGVRHFASVESLLQFISGSPIAGNVKVSVQAGCDFSCALDDSNLSALNQLLASLAASGHTLAFNKWGTGRNPVVNFGAAGTTVNTDFVAQVMANSNYVECDGVELKLWNIGFDPSAIGRLQSQTIASGAKTAEVDFSSISTDLTFQWVLQSVPEGVSGALVSGQRAIPAATIVNEGEGTATLTYLVTGMYHDTEFCQFTYTIAVSPALVGLFSTLSPANGAVSESTTVTLTWNSIRNAVYDVYLWNAQNQRPDSPVASGLTDLRFTSSNFCVNGNTYKWQVVARNDAQQLASDTMTFAVRSLPDLHVYALDCSQAVAGQKFTVSWTVRNDGPGSTGSTRWNDYVWLVTDVYGGTAPSGSSSNSAKLLATVPNVKALEAGEAYSNSVDVTLDERVYGNHYILVAADMYSVSDIQWSTVGGSVVDPYNPSVDGSTAYRHLYATTAASYNKVYEQGETPTLSDNFFYKKINIAVPDLADLQIPSITSFVVPNVDPPTSSSSSSATDALTTWQECWTASPLTAAGLRQSTGYYSGKKVAVRVTVANKGGKDTATPFRTVLYMSSSADRDAAPLTALGSITCPTHIAAGKDTTLTFAFYLPYAWHGDTYFHAYADIDDAVYELANTLNNWGASEKVDVLLCPGADLVPTEVSAPAKAASSSAFDVTYTVQNKGTGIPLPNGSARFAGTWKDAVYLSTKSTGLDDSAVLLATVNRTAQFTAPATSAAAASVQPEAYSYEGDNYSHTVTVSPKALTAGTYYVYVKVDAADNLYEYDGETNNVACSGPITVVLPDLSVDLISISADTLVTGQEVAFAWKLKNSGTGDLQNVTVTDAFYAAANPDGTGDQLIATVTNTVWIAAGSEKTLRANIKIPSNDQLNGLHYIYVLTNCNQAIQEADTANNRSAVVKSWCKYEANPSPSAVRGAHLSVSNLTMDSSVKPGQTVTVSYTARNTGDTDLPDREVSQELFVSADKAFSEAKSLKCELTAQQGSVRHLKAGAATTVTITFTMPTTLPGGLKYLHLYADRANQLGGQPTSDNHASIAFRLDGNQPDLTVTAYTLPDTLTTSTDVTLRFTTLNQGQWAAGPSTAAVYLSSSSTVGSSATQLATTAVSALAKGDKTENTVTFSIPDKIYGKWNVVVKTDASNVVDESDEDNNLVAIPVTVRKAPLPDLAVASLSTDTPLASGQAMKVKTVVANTGQHATRSDKWSDTYYLSTGTVLNTQTATLLGSKTHVGRLEAGHTYTSEVSLNIPPDLQGNYMLFAVTDASDAIAESNENNNARSIPVYISGTADNPADLALTAINAPATIKAGEAVTISYRLSNVGAYAAQGTLNDVIYLSRNKTWDKDDTMVGVVTGEVTIDPGESITRTVTGRITNVPEGNYYVVVKTNSTRTIAEQADDNNTLVASSPSALSFATISLGSTVHVSTSGYYKLEIPSGYDGKTVGFYLDHPEGASAGLYAAYETVPSTARYDVAATSSQSTQQELLLPHVKAGNYYILAQDNAALTNATGNVFAESGSDWATTDMTLRTDEVSFGATTLSIAEGGNGGWVSTDVRGALFDSIMDFRLKLAETTIPAEAVTFNGMTSSRVTFNLNNAATGSYDVVSELPDGTLATLPDGFKVVPGVSVNLSAKIEAPNMVRQGNYAPISVTYANGGNTDCEVYRLMLVIDHGYLGTTIKDLDRHESVIYLDLGTESDSRGYTAIPPGTQKTINLFMYQMAATSHLTIYVVN